MSIAVIVEGKNDRSRLRRLLLPEVDVLCTFGTPGVESLEKLKKQVQGKEIYIFTDNDPSGKKIRGLLRELFPDAIIYIPGKDMQELKEHRKNICCSN